MAESNPYQIYGKATLADLWGDWMVYRNLVPPDGRLPRFEQLRKPLGLEGASLPRKVEADYGRVVVEILRRARRLELPEAELKRLVYLGDTRLLDGMAFQNLCEAGGWKGWAFIGQDKLAEAKAVRVEGQVYLANRWSALEDFQQFLEEEGFGLDEGTVLVIDMDKTAAGGRGRNDKPIDEARLEGVRRTVAELLGEDFDEAEFRKVYAHLNQPAYHPFTADNQDYLAYICLMLGAAGREHRSLFPFETLLSDIQTGRQASFFDFIREVQGRHSELPDNLLTIHESVWQYVQADDPTPFKAFRYNEYLTTAGRYGGEAGEPLEQTLARRVVITGEVQEFARKLRSRGALIFGLSDKPDEASLPNQEQARQGMKPLHRIETLVVGER